MRLVALLIISISILGCTYNGDVKESSLYSAPSSKGRLPGTVTLIEDKTNIENVDLKIDAMTLSYDLKDAYFDASKRMLESVFSNVTVSKTPDPKSDYYAVPILKWGSTIHGGSFNRGVEVGMGLAVDLYDTKTRSLIKRFTSKTTFDHEKGGTTKSMMILNAATLLLASPIAINVAAQSEGHAAQPKLESAIRSSLESIKGQLLANGDNSGLIASPTTAMEKRQSDCIENIYKDPELDAIRGKVFSAAASRFDMVANKNKPTGDEKDAIRIYHDRLMGCFDIFAASIHSAPPEVQSLFKKMKSSFSNELVSLYSGEIGYGAYFQKSSEIWEGFQQDAARIFAEKAKTDRANELALMQMEMQSEAANNQARATASIAAAQQQANWMQYFQNIQQNMLQQRTINSINNLNSRPSSMNCTSTASGFGTINTNCY